MKFAVCAGHGGGAPGVVAQGVNEADVAVWLRDSVAANLRAMGHTVSVDSSALMRNLPLAKSIMLVPGTDAAIELHCNGAINTGATGVEVLSKLKDKARAQALAQAIAGAIGLPLRGDKGWQDQSISPHGTLGFVQAGGLIVEVFFLTNPKDWAAYQQNRWRVAGAISDALTKF